MKNQAKRRQPIPKVALVGFGITIGSVIIVLMFLGVLYPVITYDDNRIRQQLETGIAALPIPSTCHEGERKYYKSDVDARSTWAIRYDCDANGAVAHDFITTKLKTQGFRALEDYSFPGPSSKAAFYSFSYTNRQYHLDYKFFPDATINLDTQPVEQLHKSSVTQISVRLTQGWD